MVQRFNKDKQRLEDKIVDLEFQLKAVGLNQQNDSSILSESKERALRKRIEMLEDENKDLIEELSRGRSSKTKVRPSTTPQKSKSPEVREKLVTKLEVREFR